MVSFCINLFSTPNRAIVFPLHPAYAPTAIPPSGAPGYHPAAVNPYRDELTFDFRTWGVPVVLQGAVQAMTALLKGFLYTHFLRMINALRPGRGPSHESGKIIRSQHLIS